MDYGDADHLTAD